MADLTDDELMAAIGDAPIQFWMCPVRQHRDRTDDSGRPVVTVEWQGDIARCTAPGCVRTSCPGPADSTYIPDSADVLLVARALAAEDADWGYDHGFSSIADDAETHGFASAVLAALAAAGRLLPADAETRAEWTVKVNGNVMEAYAGITTEANCRAIAADPPFEGHEVIVVSRFAARGPWLPAPTTKES